jgi:hypothetical protein
VLLALAAAGAAWALLGRDRRGRRRGAPAERVVGPLLRLRTWLLLAVLVLGVLAVATRSGWAMAGATRLAQLGFAVFFVASGRSSAATSWRW